MRLAIGSAILTDDARSPAVPLVSVVTPVLNRARSITTCLASVAAQSYGRIEHVVVDGGSTDGTLEVVQAFKSRHELRWVSERDEGMYEAVNKGLVHARGDVLAYLNSDDFYLPWSIQVAVSALQGGSDVVFGDLGVLKAASGDRGTFDLEFYRPFDLTHYTHIATLGQPAVVWRGTLTGRIGGFDTSYRLIGDCEYWIRAAARGASFEHVNEVLAIQVDHVDTLRARFPDQLAAEFQRLRESYSSLVSPPAWPKVLTTERSLRWRLFHLRFAWEVNRRVPKQWPHFIGFLKRNQINITSPGRIAASMLPGRFRPSEAMRVNIRKLKRRLFDLIGATG